MEQFVAKGMCVDFAVHDMDDGNPHAHIMLTMRSMDEQGRWNPKAHKVYDLDENGERIVLPSGEYKSHRKISLTGTIGQRRIQEDGMGRGGQPVL
jgi:hypothetical protein